METVLYAARRAKELGKTVVLNPAPAQPLPDEIFSYIDYITPNRSELSRYTGMDTEGEELEQAMRRMKEMGARHVVTTLGASGSAYLNEQGEIRTIAGHSVPTIDSTGAGDCYNAGLAVAITKGINLQEAVDYAGLVSALAVTKFGAQAGMPTEVEVQHFSTEHKIIMK
ncbi:Ribokinase [compost metagenome]